MTSDPGQGGHRGGPDGVSRRRMLALGGLGGLGVAAAGVGAAGCENASPATANGSCVLTAEQTAGPYYLDLDRVRQDITEGKGGMPLRLQVTVVDAAACAPVEGAAVEIWHCDAFGYYSGFTDRSPGGAPPPEDGVGDARTFLRGTQVTGKGGGVEFHTIVPGWYAPRAVHIHTKVHTGGRARAAGYEGGHVAHTGQFYLPDDVVRRVHAQQPYAEHAGRVITLGEDTVYKGGGVKEGLMRVTPAGRGYLAAITVGIDPKARRDGG